MKVRVIAISGSLRARSSNTALLETAAALAPADVDVHLYQGLGELPHFNPDLEGGQIALPPVARLCAELKAADAAMICSPEYAHGIPGALKNLLDWVVGSGELWGKPIALVNASPSSTHAQAALREVLTTMDARVIEAASVAVPLGAKRHWDAAALAADVELAAPLRRALAALRQSVLEQRAAEGRGL